jgi:allophanate hydrolase
MTPSVVVDRFLTQPAAALGTPVWISRVADVALRARAAALDAKLASDAARALASPLFGALFAVKDNIDVAGIPTTAACPQFAYAPTRSAAVVEHLEAAGAIVVGKTNLDQFATGLVGTRSPYGAVANAFDPTYISGGSSSGSAVAVASGQVHFSLGTDTAGSGRIPAGFNNIVGMKPSRGLLSTRGVLPACRSLDCVSIFALTVADALRVFDASRGYDTEDPYSRRLPLDPAHIASEFRFGIPGADDLQFFGDGAAAVAFHGAVERLRGLGGEPVLIDFTPLHEVAALLYEGPWVAERHAAIRAYFDAHATTLDPIVALIIGGAARFSATDAFIAQSALAELRQRVAPMWRDIDVLVVPTAPTIYRIADIVQEPVELNRRLGTYTNFVNLLDLAALAVPAAFRGDGLPAGITLIGPAGSDLALADLGERFHHSTGLTLGATGAAMPAPSSLSIRAAVARIAVVGAHLSDMPLNHQLRDRGAHLVVRTRTAPHYRLFALPGTVPAKPGLIRAEDGAGVHIAVEVWELGFAAYGSFVSAIPAPLGIGMIELEDGAQVQGFVCDPAAVVGAADISEYGGWREYMRASQEQSTFASRST